MNHPLPDHLELAILEASADRTHWVEPWISRLRALRRHPDVGVRAAALDVATCPEERPASRRHGRSGVGWELSRRLWGERW